jgi:hypothetical protein
MLLFSSGLPSRIFWGTRMLDAITYVL